MSGELAGMERSYWSAVAKGIRENASSASMFARMLRDVDSTMLGKQSFVSGRPLHRNISRVARVEDSKKGPALPVLTNEECAIGKTGRWRSVNGPALTLVD